MAAAIACSCPAEASTLTWALPTVTFTSGQTATGTFTVDQQSETLIDWNIQLTGGSNATLTDLDFKPFVGCVAFCGELFTSGTPSPSGIDFRTSLAPDDTFFELNLNFNVPLSEIFNPSGSSVGLNGAGDINYEKLISPTLVTGLQRDYVTNIGTGDVALTPEPASLLSFALGLVMFASIKKRSRSRL